MYKGKNGLIVLIAIALSCNNKDSLKTLKDNHQGINHILAQFSLPYNTRLVEGNESFIYYSSKYFDTSFIVQIQRNDSVILGICYKVPPNYQKGILGYNNDQTKSSFFIGFNFNISDSEWTSLINKTNIFFSSPTSNDSSVCLDCPWFYISTGNRYKGGRLEINYETINLEKYIKDTLLKVHEPSNPIKIEDSLKF